MLHDSGEFDPEGWLPPWSLVPMWLRLVPLAVAGLWLTGVALFTWGPNHVGLEALRFPPISLLSVPKFNVWTYVLGFFVPSLHLGQGQLWYPNAAVPWGWLYPAFTIVAGLAAWAVVAAVVGFLIWREVSLTRASLRQESAG